MVGATARRRTRSWALAAGLVAVSLGGAGCSAQGTSSLRATYATAQRGGPAGGSATSAQADVVSAVVQRIDGRWTLTATLVDIRSTAALLVTGLSIDGVTEGLHLLIAPGADAPLRRLELPPAVHPRVGHSVSLKVLLGGAPAVTLSVPVQ